MSPVAVSTENLACPMCDRHWGGGGGGMMDGMMGWMGLGYVVWLLLGIALLVLTVVAIIRLWPRRPTSFRSSMPEDEASDRPP